MAFKKPSLRTGILLIIFIVLIIVVIYGGLKLSGDNGAITGTLGGSMNAITGMGIYECEYIVGGVKCASEIYEVKTGETCPDETISVCTNICELDRAIVGDDRICPDQCTEHCVPLDVAQKLNK